MYNCTYLQQSSLLTQPGKKKKNPTWLFFYWPVQGEQEILWGVYEGELQVMRKPEPAEYGTQTGRTPLLSAFLRKWIIRLTRSKLYKYLKPILRSHSHVYHNNITKVATFQLWQGIFIFTLLLMVSHMDDTSRHSYAVNYVLFGWFHDVLNTWAWQ